MSSPRKDDVICPKKGLATIFLTGLLFALGLGISGMTQPAKVIGFLDVTGDWDPSLAMVMGGAVAVHLLAYRLVKGRSSPILESRFLVPTRQDITPRLVAGSALFGLGWGIGGYCPGPGLVSLPSGGAGALVFVLAMVAGMVGFQAVEGLWKARREAASEDEGPTELAPEPLRAK